MKIHSLQIENILPMSCLILTVFCPPTATNSTSKPYTSLARHILEILETTLSIATSTPGNRLAESRRSWCTLRPHRLCLRRLRACYNDCVQSELVYIEEQVTTNVYESFRALSPQRKSRLRYAVLRSLARTDERRRTGLISPGHRISISAVTSIKPGSEHWLAARRVSPPLSMV